MGNIRIDVNVNIDDLDIDKVVYIKDNFPGSGKVRP
jgi:hypothetical protein